MTRKRFDHQNGQLQRGQGFQGLRLPDGVGVRDAADALYDRVGAEFPVSWEPWATAEPVIETDELPEGVTESDVATALAAMRDEGLL